MTKIISVRVPDNERLAFLPRHAGKSMLSVENSVYKALSRFCKDYTGGYWNFYELSNGGFYMAPDLDGFLPLFIESNGYEGEASADAAGIVSTLFALNYVCNLSGDEKLIDRYYWLRDFAGEHDEADEIFAAID